MTIRPVSILIPARMESNRLPGKMLLMVRENTPLIYETYLNVLAAIEFSHNPELYDVHVTTDSLQIESYLKSRNVSVILTRPEHEGGISRCYEASRNLSSKYFLIIQGDEPLVMSDMLDKLSAYHLNTSSHLVVCSTLATKLDSSQNCVRIVVSNDYRALYMTRSILPSNKNILTHLGVYGFSKSALSAYSKYNCSLSILESIELLRMITHDHYVQVFKSPLISARFGIDMPEDLLLYRTLFPSRSSVLSYLSNSPNNI